MNKKQLLSVVLIIATYFIGASVSFAFFRTILGSLKVASPSITSSKTNGGVSVFDDTLPKTESCPLNGALYSKQQKEWWEKHRPLGVMIENHQESRPQSGLSFADVIYEAVAEGGITRFLTLYHCRDAGFIGPVRSARTYFLDFISEYGDYPLYAHVGGANSEGPANALGQIEDYGWKLYNDMNQFSIACPIFCRYEDRLGHLVATEHTMYSTTNKLWKFAAKDRGLADKDKKGNKWDENFVSYTFKDDASISSRPENQSIHMEFWKGYSQYFVDWNYAKSTNLYLRKNGGVDHIDNNTKKVLSAKTIVALFMLESNANDGYENNLHLVYKTKGTGKAMVFMDGKQIVGTWKKDKRSSRTLVFDNNGAPIELNRGVLWFEVLPTTGVIIVK